MSTEFKMTEEAYLDIDSSYNDYTIEDTTNLNNNEAPISNAGWTSSYTEWKKGAGKDSLIEEEVCSKYFVGYALSPVIIYNSKVYISVYISINQSIELTITEHKDKSLLIHQFDSKYIRVIILND